MLPLLVFLALAGSGWASAPVRQGPAGEMRPPNEKEQIKNLPPFNFAATCQPSNIDLFFVVDRSASIGAAHFAIVKSFIHNLTASMLLFDNDDSSLTDTIAQVGLVLFDDVGQVMWDLEFYSNSPPQFILKAIDKLTYDYKGTEIANGMNAATDCFNDPSCGARKNADGTDKTRIMIIISDGCDNSDTCAAHDRAEAAGIKVYAIGVFDPINDNRCATKLGPMELMCAVGGDPSHFYNIVDFNGLAGLLNQICPKIEDPCSGTPCLNGGTCSPDPLGGFHCTCPPPWTGDMCSHNSSDPCSAYPCSDGATCVGKSDGTYYCVCPVGSFATDEGNCEYYCENDGHFKCQCDPGYTGPDCSIPIDWCQELVVMDNGTNGGSNETMNYCGPCGHCENLIAEGPICQCDPGWTGLRCEDSIDYCQDNHCSNGGTCVSYEAACPYNPNGPQEPYFVCKCPEPWIGQRCEHQPNPCNLTLPNAREGNVVIPLCVHGICFVEDPDNPEGWQCGCDDGWIGDRCDIPDKVGCQYTDHNHVTHTYPHASTWIDDCNECRCEFSDPADPTADLTQGTVYCAHSLWCPHRCAVYATTYTIAHNISTVCPLHQNCIPDVPECAANGVAPPYGNPVCDKPTGWCFPNGHIMADQLSFPTNPPTGYVIGDTW